MLLFSPPPRITVLIAYITAVSAAPVIPTTPDLTARTSTSYVNVNGLENFNVTATIVNAGDKTLKLFNDSRGVLDLFPENSFTVTTPSGSRPSFNGGSVNREPGRTMNLPILDHPGAFIVLAPSDSINATRNCKRRPLLTRQASSHRMTSSPRCAQLHPIRNRRLLYRTVGPLPLRRC